LKNNYCFQDEFALNGIMTIKSSWGGARAKAGRPRGSKYHRTYFITDLEDRALKGQLAIMRRKAVK
jgi:hypothetical protein